MSLFLWELCFSFAPGQAAGNPKKAQSTIRAGFCCPEGAVI
ncbi:hypothetical protein Daudx_0343 [Candidatus Desulforudis audaxviator]|nr:hypothetical protein Daudx_0343 [Candidatus Desulforudis audaxviator]